MARTKPRGRKAAATGKGRRVVKARRRAVPAQEKRMQAAEVRSPILDDLERFIRGVESLADPAQKLAHETSKNPPLGRNRQTRFANKVDELAAKAAHALGHYDAAREAVRGLPALAKCTPGDRSAKQLMTGLEALKVRRDFASFVDELQEVATRARQPMTPDEARKLWDRYLRLVEDLQGLLDRAADIRKLIAAHQERERAFRRESDLRLMVAKVSRTTSTPDLRKVIEHFGHMFEAMDQVDKALAAFCRGVGKIFEQHNRMTKAARDAEESILEQQERILFFLKDLIEHAKTLKVSLASAAEYQQLAADRNPGPFADIPRAVEGFCVQMDARINACIAWVDGIEKREAAAFVLPGYLGTCPSRIVSSLREAKAKIAECRQAAVGMTQGRDRHSVATTVPDDVVASLTDQEARALAQVVEAEQWGGDGCTIAEVSAAVGNTYPTVRRILLEKLGEKGLGLVRQIKHSRKRRRAGPGKASLSPSDTFVIVDSKREACRRWLEAARKTP